MWGHTDIQTDTHRHRDIDTDTDTHTEARQIDRISLWYNIIYIITQTEVTLNVSKTPILGKLDEYNSHRYATTFPSINIK